jgi:hypothetical protein
VIRHAALLIASLCAATPSSAQDLAPMCPAQRMPARYVDRPLTLPHDSLRIHAAAGYQHPGDRAFDLASLALEIAWGISDDWELSLRSGAVARWGSRLRWNENLALSREADEKISLALAWRFAGGTGVQASTRARLYTDGAELALLVQFPFLDRARLDVFLGASAHVGIPATDSARLELMTALVLQLGDHVWAAVETGGVHGTEPGLDHALSDYPYVPYRLRGGATIMGGAAPVGELWLEVEWPYLIQHRVSHEDHQTTYFHANEVVVMLHGSLAFYL